MKRWFSLQVQTRQTAHARTYRCVPMWLPLMTCLGALLLLSLASQVNALELQGKWQQGGMLMGKVAPGSQVRLGKTLLPVTPKGEFVLGLGRNAPASATLVIADDEGEHSHQFTVEQRQYAIQRIEGVPQRTVTPPESVLARIRSEGAAVSRARRKASQRMDFLTGFSLPLEGPITGVYGSQRVFNGVPKNPHYGLDIAGPEGALVHAPISGVVKLVHRDMYYSGGTLIVDHGYGISSTFIHLSDILVTEGDEIQRGEPIAKVGSTGRATGPHLDWRINWHQVRLDPAVVLESFPFSSSGSGSSSDSGDSELDLGAQMDEVVAPAVPAGEDKHAEIEPTQ